MTKRRSQLLDILLQSPAHRLAALPEEDYGLADVEPFPFLAIVGQHEMKLALILSIINPRVGGVLLIGPRGTAKTRAVRALTDLLPQVERSLCVNGCTEEMLQTSGMDDICEALDRIELEGVVAELLVRAKDGDAAIGTGAASLIGGLFLDGPLGVLGTGHDQAGDAVEGIEQEVGADPRPQGIEPGL